MVRRDRVGDRLQQHRLAGSGRRYDQAALALPDRRDQVHYAAAELLLFRLQAHVLRRVIRRQIIEENLLTRFFRWFEADCVDTNQSEIILTVFRRAHLAGDRIPRAQIEPADLRRRDIDVIRSRQVVVVGRPEEAETLGQGLENTLCEDQSFLLGLCLKNRKDQLLLAQAADAGNLQRAGYLGEFGDVVLFKFSNRHGRKSAGTARKRMEGKKTPERGPLPFSIPQHVCSCNRRATACRRTIERSLFSAWFPIAFAAVERARRPTGAAAKGVCLEADRERWMGCRPVHLPVPPLCTCAQQPAIKKQEEEVRKALILQRLGGPGSSSRWCYRCGTTANRKGGKSRDS